MIEEAYIYQLVDYIKKNLAKGYTLDSLKTALEAQDYSRSAIEKAIKITNEQLAKSLPAVKEKPRIKYKVVHDIEQQKQDNKKSFFKKIFK